MGEARLYRKTEKYFREKSKKLEKELGELKNWETRGVMDEDVAEPQPQIQPSLESPTQEVENLVGEVQLLREEVRLWRRCHQALRKDFVCMREFMRTLNTHFYY